MSAQSIISLSQKRREILASKPLRDMTPEELEILGVKKTSFAKSPLKELNPNPIPAPFTQAHVLSDADFIRATRSMNIHSKGAKALFFANGGEDYIGYDTMQTAFEALRRAKLANLKRK